MTRTLYIFDQGLKGLGGHYYEYVRSIAEAANAASIRCVVGCHQQAGDASFASFQLHPIFRDDVWGSVAGEDYHSAVSMNGVSTRFLEDVQALLAKIPPNPGDIIFLPNIAKPHVVAAALVAEAYGPTGVRTHFMFRYPSSHFEGDTAADAFRRLERASANHDVFLCTDSHRLVKNLAPLTSLPFAVFPIPHTWQGQAYTAAPRETDRPLHCVSLGNARDEKGIAEILEAVRLSSHEAWGGKLRFTLQVNDPYQVEDAIERFRRGPSDDRTTLIDESLGSEEYAALLASADVVLVPYWQSIYRERTSGVFLEGLITGKLVLCTRDTWMSDLVNVHGGGVAIEDRSGQAICDGLRKLVEQQEILQERAREAAEYWKTIHSPENLIAHLTGTNIRRVQIRPARRGKAAILFPWGEAVSGKTGASLRLKYFVRYMETAYDEVRILFVGGGESGGIIGKKSVAEPYHYSDEAKQLHDQLKAICRNLRVPEEDCFHLWFHLWPAHDRVFALRCEEMVMWADHIYVDYTYFVPVVDRLCRQHGKEYTVTIHDIVSEQAATTPFLHSATRRLELDAARTAPRLICASQTDYAVLEDAGIPAEIIPHPIDVQEALSPFSRDEARAILQNLYDVPTAGRRMCFFVGSLYPPNVEAAEAISDMAQRCEDDPRLKDVVFVVAGACMMPRRTENFAALGTVEGAALSACMLLADIILIPLLRGTGVSLKSIEALARGSLVLSTRIGMRGLDVEDGIHCRIEDDLMCFPKRIAEMLGDPNASQRMREEAQTFGEKFDFRRLMALYLAAEQPERIAETGEEFSARRYHAIKELLPRLADAPSLSAPLSAWKSEFGSTEAVEPVALKLEEPGSDEFDPEWYAATYPDVAILGMDPAEHYAWIGRALGRAPNSVGQRNSARLFHHRPQEPAGVANANVGTRWFLADPSLVNSSGHCARYLLSIAKPLRERGRTVHLLGNRSLRMNSIDLAGCEPAFTLRCEEEPFIPDVDPQSPSGMRRLEQRRSELFLQDLDRIVETHDIGRSDVLLINSLRHWSLEPLVEWLERLGIGRVPNVAVILHFTPYPQPGVQGPASAAYRDALRRIARSQLSSRILLCTDSERLCAEYRSLYDVPITVVPVPHCSAPMLSWSPDKDRISIVFAGEARSDKGFNLLPHAIRRVLETTDKPNVVFKIHAYGANSEERASAWADLSLNEAVCIHDEPLSEAEYESFIQDADLMLIPYLSGPYQAQTSGIYCEAAALGIPVVVPSNTWMAEQVAKNGGGVLFESGDEDSLANACIGAIRNYDRLRDSAMQAASVWREIHNARNFIARVEALLEGLPAAQAA